MAWATAVTCFAINTTTTAAANPLRLQPSFRNLIRSRPSCPSTVCLCTQNGKPSTTTAAGDQLFSITSANKSDVDYLGQSTKGDLNVNFDYLEEVSGYDGQMAMEGPIEEVAKMEAEEAESLLRDLRIPGPFSARHSPRGIFCSRTLNLRSISAIGYDMDYTLIHYNVTGTSIMLFLTCPRRMSD